MSFKYRNKRKKKERGSYNKNNKNKKAKNTKKNKKAKKNKLKEFSSIDLIFTIVYNMSQNKSSYFSSPPRHVFKLPIGLGMPTKGDNQFVAEWFDTLMDIRVPISIALGYATLVHAANKFRKTNNKPLAICNTQFFKTFVLIHNIGLCVYSAWTCFGMSAAMYRTVFEATKIGVAGTHNAQQYLKGESPLLVGNGFWRSLCDLNDGIWEAGLRFYGFFFYLSKFYEVFDTVIILAKGKQSSMLQTYHHAGAMLSMWAGIRFASPPIWIFVVFNSLIHTLMYFYYTLSALKVPIPTVLKRALTTAQITQFVFGGSFAFLHLFVYYFNPNTGNFSACVNDAGQSFAILFNVTYLAPLTYLFVMFFINSYLKSGRAKRRNDGVSTKSKDSK